MDIFSGTVDSAAVAVRGRRPVFTDTYTGLNKPRAVCAQQHEQIGGGL
jgi:hypothetical protein